MTKREQVIVVVCGVLSLAAGVFYAVDMSSSSASHPITPSKVGTPLTPLPQTVAAPSGISKKVDYDVLIIQKAQSESFKDPFLSWSYDAERVRTVEVKKRVKKVEKKIKAVYSGYIYQKDGSFAIINGIDYRIGEKLKGSNYIIQSIAESKVVLIEDLQTQARKPKTMVLRINTGTSDY